MVAGECLRMTSVYFDCTGFVKFNFPNSVLPELIGERIIFCDTLLNSVLVGEKKSTAIMTNR